MRFEGDVRLALTSAWGLWSSLSLALSSRLVKLEAGAPSDLREVPGLGLRGLVGAIAGQVELLTLSPWVPTRLPNQCPPHLLPFVVYYIVEA
jgi:hypothetical protein